MNKIYIVRHGQDMDNEEGILNGRRDRELTKLGREQARTVAKKLKDYDIDIIYSSPLKRAFETAQIIAKATKIDEVIDDQHLVERDFGILTGKHISEISKLATKTRMGASFLFVMEGEGVEDFLTCYKRAQKVLKEIKSRHPDKNILIVAHGDIGKMIQAAYHNWGWKHALFDTPYPDNTGILELAPVVDKVE